MSKPGDGGLKLAALGLNSPGDAHDLRIIPMILCGLIRPKARPWNHASIPIDLLRRFPKLFLQWEYQLLCAIALFRAAHLLSLKPPMEPFGIKSGSLYRELGR